MQDRRDVGHCRVLARRGQYLVLARGQRARPLAEGRGGEAGVDHPLAADRAADGAGELLRGVVLEQEAGRALLHGAAQIARPPERGEHQDLALRQGTAQLGGGVEAVGAGHLDVQQRHVGALRERRLEHLVAAGHLGHDLDVGLEREQAGKRAADHGLVLGEQDADHRADSTGTTARTRNPGPSSRGPASRRPPAWRTRASSPASPWPAPLAATAPGTPSPSSTTSTVASPSAGTRRIALWRAPLWRMTLVAASRTVQASTASTSGGSATCGRSIVASIPAAPSAVRAPSSSASSAGRW